MIFDYHKVMMNDYHSMIYKMVHLMLNYYYLNDDKYDDDDDVNVFVFHLLLMNKII